MRADAGLHPFHFRSEVDFSSVRENVLQIYKYEFLCIYLPYLYTFARYNILDLEIYFGHSYTCGQIYMANRKPCLGTYFIDRTGTSDSFVTLSCFAIDSLLRSCYDLFSGYRLYINRLLAICMHLTKITKLTLSTRCDSLAGHPLVCAVFCKVPPIPLGEESVRISTPCVILRDSAS